MLKWTGGLATAAVVGVAVGYGASEMLKPPPAPPVSLKPPLSAEIQSRVDSIVKGLIDLHTGEDVLYTPCSPNCAAISQCVFKVRVKNGVVTAIDSNDETHPNVAKEDEVMTPDDFALHRFQRRGCAAHWGFLGFYYSPDRANYPLKRVPGSKRGDPAFVRISWDEALNTLATTMKQAKDKYGPFSLLAPYTACAGFNRLGSLWGAGSTGWGMCSDDAARVMEIFHGIGSMSYKVGAGQVGNDMGDGYKYSKAYIMFGATPSTTHFVTGYAGAWYARLAREKGVPVIIVDPKYTWDAEVEADQWIPIKPGTDTALFLAMANVIIKEGLYDKAWVDKWMYGFQQQADYILGKGGTYGDLVLDTIDKTPEWAEKICAVPAETIRELARFYAKTKPAKFGRHCSITRKSRGEYGVGSTVFLQVLCGNAPYVHGGQAGSYPPGGGCSWWPPPYMGSGVSLPGQAARLELGAQVYAGPTFYRSYQWWKAVSYAHKVKNGEPSILYPGQKMTWDEWGTIVGFAGNPAFKAMFDPHVLWGGGGHPSTDYLVMSENSNKQIEAVMSMEFVTSFNTRIRTTERYCDLFFPVTDPLWEESGFGSSAYGGTGALVFHPGTVKIAGEGKDAGWFYTALCEKLGGMDLAKQWFKNYTGSANYDADLWKFHQENWETMIAPYIKSKGKTAIPFDQIKAAKSADAVFMRTEEFGDGEPWAGQGAEISTPTGKVEIFVDLLDAIHKDPKLRNQEHFDFKKRKYAQLPNDPRDLAPVAVYQPCVNGMEDPKTKKYPLMILTGKTRFSIHYLFRDPPNPTFTDCLRHSCIISYADAKARGIKDGDIVRVWNDQGSSLVPAYVTSRIMPGVVQVRCGTPIIQSKDGMDHGGASNIFTGGDDISTVGPAKVTNLVDVEKYQEGEAW